MIGNVHSIMHTAVTVCAILGVMVTTAMSEESKNFYVAANNNELISVTSSQSSVVDDMDVVVVDATSSTPEQNMEVVIILGSVSGVFLLVAAVYLAVALQKRHRRRAGDSDKLPHTNDNFVTTNHHNDITAKPRGLSWSNPNFRQNSTVTFQTALNNQPSTTVQHAVYHTEFQDPQEYDGVQHGFVGNDIVEETSTHAVSFQSERETCKSPSPSPTLTFHKDRSECDTPTGDEIQRRASIPSYVGGFDCDPAHAMPQDMSQQQLDELFLQSLSPSTNIDVNENDGNISRGSLQSISSPMNQPLFMLSPTSSCDSSPSRNESTLRVAFAHGFHPKFVEGATSVAAADDVESEGFGYCSLDRVQVVGPNTQGDPIVTEVYYRENDGSEGPVHPPRDDSILRVTKSY
eukprot:m.136065 g.136065  ORF g.136065 m.136065 type:complete len:404 (-) comp29832_c0_seq2:68-1279(-)